MNSSNATSNSLRWKASSASCRVSSASFCCCLERYVASRLPLLGRRSGCRRVCSWPPLPASAAKHSPSRSIRERAEHGAGEAPSKVSDAHTPLLAYNVKAVCDPVPGNSDDEESTGLTARR